MVNASVIEMAQIKSLKKIVKENNELLLEIRDLLRNG
jgi:hypothetical protein